ncbi:hypothetical protein BDQ17DRAFT_1199694, partial [Cyathus striatus]
LLPPNHFGGRPGHATTDSLHLLTSTVKSAWCNNKVASLLSLDVKGAFPSIAIPHLIYHLKVIGV